MLQAHIPPQVLESLVAILMRDTHFTSAVQQQSPRSAAVAAVTAVKV